MTARPRAVDRGGCSVGTAAARDGGRSPPAPDGLWSAGEATPRSGGRAPVWAGEKANKKKKTASPLLPRPVWPRGPHGGVALGGLQLQPACCPLPPPLRGSHVGGLVATSPLPPCMYARRARAHW